MGLRSDMKKPLGHVVKRDLKMLGGKVKEAYSDFKKQRAIKKEEISGYKDRVRTAEKKAYWEEKEKVAVIRGKERARSGGFLGGLSKLSQSLSNYNTPKTRTTSSVRTKVKKPTIRTIPKTKRVVKKRRKPIRKQVNETSMIDRINKII